MNQQNSEFAKAFMNQFEGPKAAVGGGSGWADEFASQNRGITLKRPGSIIQAGAMQARGVPQVMRAPVMQPGPAMMMQQQMMQQQMNQMMAHQQQLNQMR